MTQQLLDASTPTDLSDIEHTATCSITSTTLKSRTLKVGVIIPAYNEEKPLGNTLESIINAGIVPAEIYVIDDCSTDRTPEVAAAYGVNLMRNSSNMGKAESIKRIIDKWDLLIACDLVAFFDADTVVDPDYFSMMLYQVHRHQDVALFIGQVKSQRHNWLTSARALEYTFMHDIYKSAQSRYSMITVGPGCASLYRTRVLEEILISNDTLAEDMDWTIQVYRKGLGKTLYVPEAIVHTQDPETLHDYLRQIRRWYTGSWQVIKKYGIPFKLTRIDLEIGLLYIEGMVYSLLLTLLPLLLPFLLIYHLRWVGRMMLLDLLMFSGLAIYSSVRNRRPGIFLCFPLYYITRFLNAYIFLESFYRIYFKKEVNKRWENVKRY